MVSLSENSKHWKFGGPLCHGLMRLVGGFSIVTTASLVDLTSLQSIGCKVTFSEPVPDFTAAAVQLGGVGGRRPLLFPR